MSVIAGREDSAAGLRDQISSMRGLLALSMLMTERRQTDEILHLATTAVPALVPASILGVHLTFGDGARWHATSEALDVPATRADVLAQLQHLPTTGGPLVLTGLPWAYAFALLSPIETIGCLIVTAPRPPSDADVLLLRSLAQQTGIALSNARLHAGQKATNAMLTEMISALRHKTEIHDRFTQVALDGGGQQGVVDALYGLTGLPAVVEDSTGRVLVSAGPPGARIRRATFTGRREVVLKDAARSGRPVRADDRLLAVVRPHPDVMGVLMLIDPAGLAGEQEMVALEHAATVLAIELARLHGLAETELRLGRNLVSDLVMGGDDDAVARAQVLGHDMRRPQRVMVLGSTRRDQDFDELLMRVRERIGGSIAAAGSAPPPLLMQVDRSIVVIVSMAAAGSDLPQDLLQLAGRGGRIGIGGICRIAGDYPRSYREAQLAMRLARDARSGSAIVRHEDLGVYQLLSESADPRVLDAFVDRWLGPLVNYDAERSSDLVATLTAFLEMGGNYDATAERLMLGRSTVRYRIRRVQQLTSHDLSDVETRFQLQLATRARATMRALAETRVPDRSSP